MKLDTKLFGLLAIFFFSFQFRAAFASSEQAYVTLLYGDEFLLGVRVLGKSIRETGSNKDMVVLVSEDSPVQFAEKFKILFPWVEMEANVPFQS
ncbi:hypothetical protein Q3G72_027652 [Acer saccharum]|nr:hypothetical protein Q3G72_027652 [Acer saccharum]